MDNLLWEILEDINRHTRRLSGKMNTHPEKMSAHPEKMSAHRKREKTKAGLTQAKLMTGKGALKGAEKGKISAHRKASNINESQKMSGKMSAHPEKGERSFEIPYLSW